jgi:hypothetical protein
MRFNLLKVVCATSLYQHKKIQKTSAFIEILENLVRHLFQLPWIADKTADLICMGGMIFLLHDSKIDVKYAKNTFGTVPSMDGALYDVTTVKRD